MQPVLRALLASEHFFDSVNMGCLIKSPLDFTVGTARQLQIAFPAAANLTAQYAMWNYLNGVTNLQQQVLEKTDDSEFGKFGWVMDPEGNKVELWQPPEGQ